MTPGWTEGSAEASPPLPQPTMAPLSNLQGWRLSQPTSTLRSQPGQGPGEPERGRSCLHAAGSGQPVCNY